MKFKDIDDVENEITRFQKRLQEFRNAQAEVMHNRQSNNGKIFPQLKANGAMRRAAHDLKVELTKITQGTIY